MSNMLKWAYLMCLRGWGGSGHVKHAQAGMFYVYGGPWRISSEEGFVVGGGGCKTPPSRISSEGEACGNTKIRYFSRFGSITLNDREARFSQPKLELYGLFRSVRALRLYLIGL